MQGNLSEFVYFLIQDKSTIFLPKTVYYRLKTFTMFKIKQHSVFNFTKKRFITLQTLLRFDLKKKKSCLCTIITAL